MVDVGSVTGGVSNVEEFHHLILTKKKIKKKFGKPIGGQERKETKQVKSSLAQANRRIEKIVPGFKPAV